MEIEAYDSQDASPRTVARDVLPGPRAPRRMKDILLRRGSVSYRDVELAAIAQGFAIAS